jgi:serine/threonine protein phosphatase 1
MPLSVTQGIYAVGDVHGRLDELDRILSLIHEDIACRGIYPARTVFLGDYVDRGPDTRGVIERLISLRASRDIEPIYLQGNHEVMLLSGEGGREALGLEWLRHGGRATAESYGIDLTEKSTSEILESFYTKFPESHRQFLDSLALYHSEGGYFFSHAGVDPGLPIGLQGSAALLWGHQPFLNSETPWLEVVVHGHFVTRDVVVKRNRIGIDTGSGFSGGRLSAVFICGAIVRIL